MDISTLREQLQELNYELLYDGRTYTIWDYLVCEIFDISPVMLLKTTDWNELLVQANLLIDADSYMRDKLWI